MSFRTGWVAVAAAVFCAACSGAPAPQPAANPAEVEIRDLFATYLRLHAAKDMDGWQALFLPEAIAVETMADGSASVYPVSELARFIADAATRLDSQHETLEEMRIETAGGAASCSTRYVLFHNGDRVDSGRAFFLLARREGRWRITSLTWFSE